MSLNERILPFIGLVIACLISVAIFVVFGAIFSSDPQSLEHFFANLFPRYIKETTLLLICVCGFSLLLGVSLAYLVANFSFTASKFFNIILMLPFSIPAYILAFIYVGIMDWGGIFEDLFGFRINFFGMGGAIFVLTISLYPYIYLFARASFISEGKMVFDVGKLLGLSKFEIFYKIAIFISRPAIIAGALLVAMETLSDYGTAAYLGVDTFSAGIFKLWFDLNDLGSAGVLSAILILVVFILILIEYKNSHAKSYSFNSDTSSCLQKTRLKGVPNFLAVFYCFCVSFLGFIMPFFWLTYHSLTSVNLFSGEFYMMGLNSFKIAFISAVFITLLAFFLNFSARVAKTNLIKTAILKLSCVGYAMPGAVIGVSLLVVFMQISNLIDARLLGTSIIVLITGYTLRYLATAMMSFESGYSKLHKNLDEAAKVMGVGKFRLAFLIHAPLLRHFFTLSFIIVFVDTIKELPLSLILRPFDFETLSIRAFFYATDERVYDACLPAFFIVLISIFAILWIELRRNDVRFKG